MWASLSGKTGACACLLKAGANKDAQDKNGKTALTLATEFKHAEVIQLLQGKTQDESIFTASASS